MGYPREKTEVRPEVWIDKAVENRFVENPEKFAARLKELAIHTVDPGLPGIEVKFFIAPDETEKGFVVCYIPEGSHKPYRSELLGEKLNNYYIRVSDSGIVAPRPFLQQLFNPSITPHVILNANKLEAPWLRDYVFRYGGGQIIRYVKFTVFNEGPISLKEIFILIESPHGKVFFTNTATPDPQGFPSLISHHELYSPVNRSFLHPGMKLELEMLIAASHKEFPCLFRLMSENVEMLIAPFDVFEHWTIETRTSRFQKLTPEFKVQNRMK